MQAKTLNRDVRTPALLLHELSSELNLCLARSLSGMARYHFDFQPDGELYPDEQGMDLSGLVAAKDQAINILAAISRDVPPHAGRRELAIKVRDRSKHPLLKVTLVVEQHDVDPAYARKLSIGDLRRQASSQE